MCADENGSRVFTNRPAEYRECKEYVPPPGLREELHKQMLKQQQEGPSDGGLEQPRTAGKIIGPP